MKRLCEKWLEKWKNDPHRKVLLLRGARQVGKTYVARKLGESFASYVEVNFEEDRKLKGFFEQTLDPQTLCSRLGAYLGRSIEPGKTLLFLDEIQSCPRALSALRFFYEKMPQLHVIAAGSLLEFALGDIPSQGVGRIQSLFMYPLSFAEFLEAISPELFAFWDQHSTDTEMDEVLHGKLIEILRSHLLVGGLPEVVQRFVDTRDYLQCQELLSDLLLVYQDDFAKYKKHSPTLRLQEVFRSVAGQAGSKFKYAQVDSESAPVAIKEALGLLEKAGLVYRVTHASGAGIPLGSQINSKRFKIIPFDLGLHQRLLGLNLGEFLLAKDFGQINKGSIAEVFAGLEYVYAQPRASRPELFYWHREAPNSNAEVDYLMQKNDRIWPVEVKSGKKGSMRSLFRFLEEYSLAEGFRLSLENVAHYDKVRAYPLYFASKVFVME